MAGRQEPTQVGRVLATLGVGMLDALSGLAKGRVERLWGVLQDRLISELRLAGASTRGQANNSTHATYAGKDVLVKHLLSGDYRVFYGAECIAWARGLRPRPSTNSNRNNDKDDDPGGDIFT